MPVTRAMLMAAGLGTRLRPFTDEVPKALVPLMGAPIAQFAVDAAVRAGVDKIVANVHHHAATARAGLLALDRSGAEMMISDEREELLGSAGGLRKALPRFEGNPFFLINADVLCDVSLRELARRHEALKSERNVAMTLAVFRKPPTDGKYREIFLDHESGLVSGFSRDLRQGKPFFIGSAVLENDAFENVPLKGPSEFVPTILEPMIAARKAGFFLADGIWRDVGSPALWLDAHLGLIELLETGRLPEIWRKRIEHHSRRISNGVWASKTFQQTLHWDHLSPPCYFSGNTLSGSLGPHAVYYGDELAAPFSDGIGMGRHRITVSVPTQA